MKYVKKMMAVAAATLAACAFALTEEELDALQITIDTTETRYSEGTGIKHIDSKEISNATLLDGHGGLQIRGTFSVKSTGIAVLDPVHLPIYTTQQPSISGKLALKNTYKHYTCGKMVLMTWDGDELASLPEFTNTTSAATATLSQQLAPDGQKRQLVLTLGDYEADKIPVSIMPIGDSITEGCGDWNNSNYRIPLCQKLTAAGYDVTTHGWMQTVTTDGAYILAPEAWRRHSARGGNKLIWQPSNDSAHKGAVREYIEAALDQAGEPDIITLKIGTNDLGHDTAKTLTAATVFESLTNVLWRIHEYRPTTKVVLSTILDLADSSNEWKQQQAAEYVRLILDLGENSTTTYGFPENFLFVVNAYQQWERSSRNFVNANDVHPSWTGHDMFSELWFHQVTNAVAHGPVRDLGASADRTPFPPNTLAGAEANVPSQYRAGFTKAATLNLSATSYFANGSMPQYTICSEDATNNAGRVAYYLELKRKGSEHRRFVWVDMATFAGRGLDKFGLPSNYSYQGTASKLHVYSNDPAVHNIAADDDSHTGWLEFTPNAYTTATSGVSGAPEKYAGAYGWNDKFDATKDYGSFQVFRCFKEGEYFELPAQVVFCHNRWSKEEGGVNEIGIGNFAQHVNSKSISIDYTGMVFEPTGSAVGAQTDEINANAYDVMSLEIWTSPLEPVYVEDGGAVSYNTVDELPPELSFVGSGSVTVANVDIVPALLDELFIAGDGTVTVTVTDYFSFEVTAANLADSSYDWRADVTPLASAYVWTGAANSNSGNVNNWTKDGSVPSAVSSISCCLVTNAASIIISGNINITGACFLYDTTFQSASSKYMNIGGDFRGPGKMVFTRPNKDRGGNILRNAGNTCNIYADIEVQANSQNGATIQFGAHKNGTTSFHGAISGAGPINVAEYNNDGAGYTYIYGDMSEFTGTMTINLANNSASLCQFAAPTTVGGTVKITDNNGKPLCGTAGTYTFASLSGEFAGGDAEVEIVTGGADTAAQSIAYTAGTADWTLKKQGSQELIITGSDFAQYILDAGTLVTVAEQAIGTGIATSVAGKVVVKAADSNTYSLDDAPAGVTVETEEGGSVTVSAEWLESNGIPSATAADLTASRQAGADSNGYSYFACYALDLDPTDPESVPLATITTDADGNLIVGLSGCGTIPDGVTIELKLLSATSIGANVAFTEKETASVGSGVAQTFTITPSAEMSCEYFKVGIGIK